MEERRFKIEDLARLFAGERIVIVGNGPTGKAINLSECPFPVWTVNSGRNIHPESAVEFQMDDIHGPAARTVFGDGYAEYLEKIRESRVPIITSCAYEEYPSLVDYPLEQVLNHFYRINGSQTPYFGETVNYMIAWAVVIGVKAIDFWGVDYIDTRPAERASAEHWVGIAKEAGIAIRVGSPLSHFLSPQPLDGINHHVPGLYGYLPHNVPIDYQERPNGRIRFALQG